jgi:mono/diheme cytochrome c family protein
MKTVAAILFCCAIAAAVQASPRSDYMIHCMGCHTMNGQGMPPEVPAFDSLLGRIVSTPEGRAYLAQVPGASQSPLDDEKLAGVLTWVLREFAGDSLPVDFQDISTQEVSQVRSVTLANPAMVRERLLLKLGSR